MTFGARPALVDLFDPGAIAARTAAVSLCRAALGDAAGPPRALVAGVGESSTTIVFAAYLRPVAFWTVAHPLVSAAVLRAAKERLCQGEAMALVQAAAREAVSRSHLPAFRGLGCELVAASRVARAIVTMGSDGGARASLGEVTRATGQLLERSIETRIRGFPGDWVRAFAVGAAILEAVMVTLAVPFLSAPTVVGAASTGRRRSTIVTT
jgi:hypothetical protein